MELATLQYFYYSLGIVFMTLFFVGLLVIIILIIVILFRINNIHKQVNDIVTDVKEHPGEKAAEILLAVGSKIAESRGKKSEKI